MKIETIEADERSVKLKGFTEGTSRYSILSFPSDIDVPRIGSRLRLTVEVAAPETDFQPQVLQNAS